ncbi:MAG TPA: tol-pal system protein YbgF [Rhodocyclaceae bacterium]|nr:tol-pal system protein YbgF [Rhodocyclaceae bacterium]
MRAGLPRPLVRRVALLAALLAGLPATGSAGVFDDDIARAQITKTQEDLGAFRAQTSATLERLESALKMQVELASQIEAARGDIAKLRGQVEVLNHASETGEKRQRDFYLDLDGRLRKIEGTVVELQAKAAAAAAAAVAPPPVPKIDPLAETRVYEDALNLFKANKYKEAQQAFQNFLRDYPAGSLAPSAHFWLANTHYAQRDCKTAIEAHNVVVTQYPESNKAPDSMLAVATCQQELKDTKGARKTLEKLVVVYSKSPAAESARQRLKRK